MLTTDSHKPVKPKNILSRASLAVAYMQYLLPSPINAGVLELTIHEWITVI